MHTLVHISTHSHCSLCTVRWGAECQGVLVPQRIHTPCSAADRQAEQSQSPRSCHFPLIRKKDGMYSCMGGWGKLSLPTDCPLLPPRPLPAPGPAEWGSQQQPRGFCTPVFVLAEGCLGLSAAESVQHAGQAGGMRTWDHRAGS